MTTCLSLQCARTGHHTIPRGLMHPVTTSFQWSSTPILRLDHRPSHDGRISNRPVLQCQSASTARGSTSTRRTPYSHESQSGTRRPRRMSTTSRTRPMVLVTRPNPTAHTSPINSEVDNCRPISRTTTPKRRIIMATIRSMPWPRNRSVILLEMKRHDQREATVSRMVDLGWKMSLKTRGRRRGTPKEKTSRRR